MLNLSRLVLKLKDKTEWQETPLPLTDTQYLGMVIDGLERLFVDTGRATEFDENKFTKTVTNTEEEDIVEYFYDANFILDERKYIEICALIGFFEKVQSDVNNTFGYSTDALTVTNADKPYANLKDTIDRLDNERRILYYKMVRYTLGTE